MSQTLDEPELFVGTTIGGGPALAMYAGVGSGAGIGAGVWFDGMTAVPRGGCQAAA